VEFVLTGSAIVAAAAVLIVPSYPQAPHWGSGILFDDAVRHALRARDPGVRDVIRAASDITLLAMVAHAALIDGLAVPLLDRSPSVAAQLSLINAQAFALTTLLSTVLFKAVARARPLITDCEHDGSFDPLCKVGAYASFPSSHTSTAFTAAGLSCVHHGALPLYGGPWDAVACVGSLTMAAATGLLRIIGDRHYATDVLAGAAMGLIFGYLYPRLVHYHEGESRAQVLQPPAATPLLSISGVL
jgi:membrane-associated phospholipid phosphatase